MEMIYTTSPARIQVAMGITFERATVIFDALISSGFLKQLSTPAGSKMEQSEEPASPDIIIYDFEAEKYNTDIYFGVNLYKYTKMKEVKKAFEEDYPNAELLQIHSIATEERTKDYWQTYDHEPKPSKNGTNSACRIVWKNKITNEEKIGSWVFQFVHGSASLCAANCAYYCAYDVRIHADFRGAVLGL